MPAPSTNAYLRSKVLSASPQQLRMMLYDGALRFCRQGRTALEHKQHEQSYESLIRAQQIVLELASSLNHDADADLCEKLSALYTYIYRLLVNANVERETSIIDEAIDLIEYERETWRMLLDRTGHQAEPAASPARQIADYAPAGLSTLSRSA